MPSGANKEVLEICSEGITVSPQINLDLSHFPPATMHGVFICRHHTNNLGCTHDKLSRLGRLRRFKSLDER